MQSRKNSINAYVGRCQCGSIVAAVVDDPERKISTSLSVCEFIRNGYVVERQTVEFVRLDPCICKENLNPKHGG